MKKSIAAPLIAGATLLGLSSAAAAQPVNDPCASIDSAQGEYCLVLRLAGLIGFVPHGDDEAATFVLVDPQNEHDHTGAVNEHDHTGAVIVHKDLVPQETDPLIDDDFRRIDIEDFRLTVDPPASGFDFVRGVVDGCPSANNRYNAEWFIHMKKIDRTRSEIRPACLNDPAQCGISARVDVKSGLLYSSSFHRGGPRGEVLELAIENSDGVQVRQALADVLEVRRKMKGDVSLVLAPLQGGPETRRISLKANGQKFVVVEVKNLPETDLCSHGPLPVRATAGLEHFSFLYSLLKNKQNPHQPAFTSPASSGSCQVEPLTVPYPICGRGNTVASAAAAANNGIMVLGSPQCPGGTYDEPSTPP